MDNATKKFAETPSETLPEDLFALSPGGEPGSQSEKVTSKRAVTTVKGAVVIAQIKNKDDTPTMRDLNRYVVRKFAADWKNVGIELGLQLDTLKIIAKNNLQQTEDCFQEVLDKWLKISPNATWKTLEVALTNVIRQQFDLDPVDDVCDIVESSIATMKLRSTEPTLSLQTRTDHSSDVTFSDPNVHHAFSRLENIFMRKIEDNPGSFGRVRQSCANKACESTISLGSSKNDKLSKKIHQTRDAAGLFCLFSNNRAYHNWMSISFFDAITVEFSELITVLEKYKSDVFKRTLNEVWQYIPRFESKKQRFSARSDVEVKLKNRNLDQVTVYDFLKDRSYLEGMIAQLVVKKIEKGCITITGDIPTSTVYQSYLSSLIMIHQSQFIEHLQIGAWVVHSPQHVVQDQKRQYSSESTPTLVFGYYYDVLLMYINADQIVTKMISAELLSLHDQDVIFTGHSVYQRNKLLLHYVKFMDVISILVFCKLNQSIWPWIGSQFVAAVQSESLPDDKVVQDDSTTAQLTVPKFESTGVHIAFLCLIEMVKENLHIDSVGIKNILKKCASLLASNKGKLPLFSNNQISKLKECQDSLLKLMWKLSPFITWSDHSLFRVLIDSSTEVVKLLDEFDSRIMHLMNQPISIASYPIPHFSPDMIPTDIDSSTHTILAIRCEQELYKCSLQYVTNVRSMIMDTCDITEHCLQLLAIRSDPIILYWTIPKCVVSLISSNVPHHSEALYSQGILEVIIYPNSHLNNGDEISIGELAFALESDISEVQVKEQLESSNVEIKHLDSQQNKSSEKIIKELETSYVSKKMKLIAQIKETKKQLEHLIILLKEKLSHLKRNSEKGTEDDISIKGSIAKTEFTDAAESSGHQDPPSDCQKKQPRSSTNEQQHSDPRIPSSEKRRPGPSETVIGTEDSYSKPSIIKKHTVFHALHDEELQGKCPFYDTKEKCQANLNKEFKDNFNKYLAQGTQYNVNRTEYNECIKDHLMRKNCPLKDCPKLWRFCFMTKVYDYLKFGREGLVIFSKYNKKIIGSLSEDNFGIIKKDYIGRGVSGKVYKCTLKSGHDVAVKIEKKHPLIHNPEVFEHMMELNNKHVVRMSEYILGPTDESDNQSFYFVMPYMNKRGLHKQFSSHDCVLAYMSHYKDKEKIVFRNYVIMFLHVLRGLQYLQSRGIVHRDIKVSNILVHQSCKCTLPLLCECPRVGSVQYLLGDVNLMSVEDSQSTIGEWNKMLKHTPTGTRGMMAPELFFVTDRGVHFNSHKSDVYSACATMMEVLVGKIVNAEPHKQIAEFVQAVGTSAHTLYLNIDGACNVIDDTLKKIKNVFKSAIGSMDEKVDSKRKDSFTSQQQTISNDFSKLKKLLHDGRQYAERIQAFQGKFNKIYTDECPFASILTNVYGANSLHWVCLQHLPHVYGTKLWEDMKSVLTVITEGVKFMPKNRPDATELIGQLEKLHSPETDLKVQRPATKDLLN
ncbi:uncharacterized protein [Dysidea avara]|uniref:uncharacterized protein isoform X2 n=1 Tax=Dysidea avara TaxID=196820 RepID=UPI0033258850